MEDLEKIEAPIKKKSGLFQKIPANVILSPGGIILGFFAITGDLLDLIPAFFIGEILLEIVLIVLVKLIIKDISWKALIIPFAIERFDFLGILPTWGLKALGFF